MVVRRQQVFFFQGIIFVEKELYIPRLGFGGVCSMLV